MKDYAVYGAKRTEPVGKKQPNGLGLYDMSGNVWEWVEDCWNEDYKGAPKDGSSAWVDYVQGDCRNRVLRGGSWSDEPGGLHTSDRSRYRADHRYSSIGFRLAQDLP